MSSQANNNDLFFQAAALGQFEAVKEFIANGMDINTKCQYEGDTALTYAASEGDVPMVKWLLDNGADPDILNDAKETALHYATYNNSLDIVELLIEHGCELDYPKNSPLIWAMRRDLQEMTHLMIKGGANLNQQDDEGDTPLMLAAEAGRKEIVRMLIDGGADISLKNKLGETAEDLAREDEHTEIVAMFEAVHEQQRLQERHVQRGNLRRYLRGNRPS